MGHKMTRYCGYLLLWVSAFWTVGTGCPDGLWFQSSIVRNVSRMVPNHGRSSLVLSSVTVQDAAECSLTCFQHPLCQSAIYNSSVPRLEKLFFQPERHGEQEIIEDNGRKNGQCTLLTTNPACKQENGLISRGRHPQSTLKPVLVYCFSCSPYVTPAEIEDGNLSKNIFHIREHKVDGTPTGNVSSGDGGGDARQRQKRSRQFSLRVMSFNCWISGDMVDRGLDKIARHILANDVDIVFLQEMNDEHLPLLLSRLGTPKWSACTRNGGRLNQIVTRQRIVTEYDPSGYLLNNGCQIQFFAPDEDFIINVWNVHLSPLVYGPYRACSQNRVMRSTSELWDCEAMPQDKERSRINNIFQLANHETFGRIWRQASSPSGPPLIVAGDFNAPSHLDWIDQARDLHCGWQFEWPVSKFMERMGFIDSYRVVFPDPVRQRGATWSAIYQDSTDEFVNGRPIPEPQDRIDYIYFKGNRLQVIDSYVYNGATPIRLFPNHVFNDWPSDHSSVVTHFAWFDSQENRHS